MKSFLVFAFVHALALLSGPAIAQEMIAVQPGTLAPAPSHISVQLDEAIVWTRKAKSWMQSDLELGLLSGNYNVQLTNATGTFYFGPEMAVYTSVAGKGYTVYNGGIWLPSDPKLRPRYFVVETGKSPRKGKTLSEALASSPPERPTFPLLLSLIDYIASEAGKGEIFLLQEVADEAVASRLVEKFSVGTPARDQR